jgi:pentatricopeptide repeat protein
MAFLSEVVSVLNLAELMRALGMEFAIASFAAIIFATASGLILPGTKVRSKKGIFKEQHTQKPHGPLGNKRNAFEPTGHQVVAKHLRQGNVKSAIDLLHELSEGADGYVPANLAPRVLMAVAKSSDHENLMIDMSSFAGKFEARSLEAVVAEAAKNKDVAAGSQLLAMSRTLSITKSSQVCEALAKLCANDVSCLRSLIEEADSPLARPFAKAVLEACAALKDVDLASEVFEKVADSDASMLRSTVEKAATTATTAAPTKEMSIACKEIRSCGKSGDFEGAMKIFEDFVPAALSPMLFNSIMDACVECGKLDRAMEFFRKARDAGMVDAVSYNTAMKGHVSQGDVNAVKGLFAEISEKGLSPTHVSYHILLNSYINAGKSVEVWQLVRDMQTAGVLPSAITCSILLKGKLSSSADIKRILSLVDTDKPIDEVLFQALAEACIRTGQLQLLSEYRAKMSGQGKSCALGVATYGSMIKAFGSAYDVKNVWSLWEEMIGHGVQPTSITLGCMIEALVANWCTADAWKLVQDMLGEEDTRPLVNTVIYSTIIKGFAQAKETDRVMSLYDEMCAAGIRPNNITYNTILNAFAQGSAMDRVPALLEDMKKADPPAEPDIVTYSTIIKGYCNSGSLDRAFEMMKCLESDTKFTPDEVLYNILLDGCAKAQRPDDAMKLLDDMRKNGVPPSNFTLSMLVKLMGRCRRVQQAFTLLEDISREYHLKINIQVYTCLIQACFNNRRPKQAVALHEKIIREGLFPDEMTYTALVKGCLVAGLVDEAIHLAKCAYGLNTPSVKGIPSGIDARCLEDLLGAMEPADAKSLRADIAGCQVCCSNKKSKGKGKGKGESKVAPTNAPWRQQKP